MAKIILHDTGFRGGGRLVRRVTPFNCIAVSQMPQHTA